MCGICSRLNFDRSGRVDAGLLERMMDQLEHRGPDGSGQHLSGPVGSGHRRLSIINLETGAQPMCNEALLHKMLNVDTKTWLPDDLLVKADKMTMATSVELRVSLLDHELLEFAASLPPSFKVRGRSLKRVLKAALAESVPRAILDRKKTGFPVPYDRSLRTELGDFVADTVLAEGASIREYFRNEELKSLVDQHQAGLGGAKEVFSLLALELWHRCFLGAPALHVAPAELAS